MKANMTNEEMANDLAQFYSEESDYKMAVGYDCAIAMAEWKDEQFKESVNKAMEYLETNLQLTEAESTHIRKLFNF